MSAKGTIPLNLQLSLSDQLYRQSKIDEENRRLKKKSKSDGGSSKKGKKSKKSDATAADENDEDLYPVIKVTRGGELPEGANESGNEDNDQEGTGKKNRKIDPHRALNIDLDEKAVPKPVIPPPPPVQEPPPKPIESPPATTKKPKKKKSTEKEGKPKRERGDYKELLSPTDDTEKTVVPQPTAAAVSTKSEEKPKKKKKAKESKSLEPKSSDALLFDMMSDDIHPTSSSNQTYNEQIVYKPIAQSDDLTIVSH